MTRDATRLEREYDRGMRSASTVMMDEADDLARNKRRAATAIRRRTIALLARETGKELAYGRADLWWIPLNAMGKRDPRHFSERLPELVELREELRPGPVRHTRGGVTTVVEPRPAIEPLQKMQQLPSDDVAELAGVIGFVDGLHALRAARGWR